MNVRILFTFSCLYLLDCGSVQTLRIRYGYYAVLLLRWLRCLRSRTDVRAVWLPTLLCASQFTFHTPRSPARLHTAVYPYPRVDYVPRITRTLRPLRDTHYTRGWLVTLHIGYHAQNFVAFTVTQLPFYRTLRLRLITHVYPPPGCTHAPGFCRWLPPLYAVWFAPLGLLHRCYTHLTDTYQFPIARADTPQRRGCRTVCLYRTRGSQFGFTVTVAGCRITFTAYGCGGDFTVIYTVALVYFTFPMPRWLRGYARGYADVLCVVTPVICTIGGRFTPERAIYHVHVCIALLHVCGYVCVYVCRTRIDFAFGLRYVCLYVAVWITLRSS